MTVDLRDQLRELCAVIDDEQGPITTDFIEARNDEVVIVDRPTSRTQPASGRWLVAVTAAIAVLVLVGGVALLFSLTGTDSPVAISAQTWSRVPHDESVFGGVNTQWMESVTVGGPGFVAVGWDEPGEYEHDAAVWTSVDGVTWSRVPHDETVFGGASLRSVTAGGPGLVAVGTPDPYSGEAPVWTSVEGITWSLVPHDEAVFGGGEMSSVTAGGPGLVAVGSDRGDAAVWTSVDGVTWSRVPHDEAVFGGTTNQTMLSVTVGGPGLVAVGQDSRDANRDQDAAVWTSPDGLTWARVPHDEAVFGGNGALAMLSVTAGDTGLVAVGRATSGVGVWTSPDGFTWSRVPDNEATFNGAMLGVAASGPGFVAVGWAGSGAAIWVSPDGVTWSRVLHDESVFGTQKPDLPALEMRSITAGASRLVAVGANKVHDTSGATKPDAAVWVTEED